MKQYTQMNDVHVQFKYIPHEGLWIVADNKELQVKQFKIWANGTKDLCLYETDDGAMSIKYTRETPSDKIIHVFEGDFLEFELVEKDPPPYGKYIFMEVNETWLPMLRQITEDNPTEPGRDFDAYLGGDYGQRGNLTW